MSNAERRDIYTLEPIQQHSDEHVLLDSLGGRLKLRGLIDKRTNDEFGYTIDKALENFVASIRVLLGTASGSKKPPQKLKNLSGADGQHYNLKPGGEPELSKSKIQFSKLPDGRLQVEGRVTTRDELGRLAERVLTREGVGIEEFIAAAENRSEPSPILSVKQELGSAGRRCIAKMASNLFAKDNYAVFLSESFNELREYVLHDRDSREPVGVLNASLALDWSKTGFSTLDHVIGYHASEGTIIGLVILFGHYQFVVYMGSTRDSIGLTRATYRVNPFLRLERFDEDLSLLDKLGVVSGHLSYDWNPDMFVAATNAILRFVKGDTLDAFKQALIEKVITERWKLDTRLTTNAATCIARKIVEEYAIFCHVHGANG